ncbi:hypothetical protein [Roseiflexus castenholzii]|uniref:hypothetical protein n=1 Tax=Roseiflexus castenholzii TaxID=120962 RepID=UPI003C7DC7D6
MRTPMPRRLALMALIVSLLLVVPAPAVAQSPQPEPTVTVPINGEQRTVRVGERIPHVHVVMPLVTANSYDEALLIYQQSRSDGTSPQDTRVGNCGSATMDIYDDGNLLVRLDYGATSIRGSMIEQEWTWILYQQGFLGFFSEKTRDSGVDHRISTSWGRTEWRSVADWGAGTYKGVLSRLRVVLGDGTECYGLQPEDTQYVD